MVLKLREILISTLLYHPFLFQGKTNASSRSSIYLAMSLARGYNSDPGVDHWTTVKIIIRRLRKYFSVMEVIKSTL